MERSDSWLKMPIWIVLAAIPVLGIIAQIRHKESIELAKKPLKGKKTAFVWDTLAEAYFKNGFYGKAADAAHNALKSAEAG